jgi:hypothetical protein
MENIHQKHKKTASSIEKAVCIDLDLFILLFIHLHHYLIDFLLLWFHPHLHHHEKR